MNTNVLNIFGYCFIFEIFIMVTVIFSSILRSFIDRKTKERNYKYMVKNEEKLRKEAEKEKTNETKKNIKDILNFSIDKDQGVLEFKEPVNLKKESTEFKINSIDIEPEDNSKIMRGNYSIDSTIIPTSFIDGNHLHLIRSVIQFPIYKNENEKLTQTSESEAIDINLIINPKNGKYINNSSKSVKCIHLSCLIVENESEEEKRERDFNKKLTTSKETMNELLENAVSEGLVENNNSEKDDNK